MEKEKRIGNYIVVSLENGVGILHEEQGLGRFVAEIKYLTGGEVNISVDKPYTTDKRVQVYIPTDVFHTALAMLKTASTPAEAETISEPAIDPEVLQIISLCKFRHQDLDGKTFFCYAGGKEDTSPRSCYAVSMECLKICGYSQFQTTTCD